MNGNLFSESWYRVRDLKVRLLHTVTIHKQRFRGQIFYVLSDPLNQHFFRIRPEAYDFIMRLNLQTRIEDVWNDCLIQNPQRAPTQDEVIRLLSQLHTSGLLYFENLADSEAIFKRISITQEREAVRQLSSILFLKIPLWDPESFLKRNEGLIRLIISPAGLIVFIVFLALGLKTALDHWQMLTQNSEGILAPDNLVWLYLCLAALKFLHELGHAAFTKRFGGEVHTMGLMFLILTPLPYMDASASWAFRNKWHRILVSAAGMIVELFLAAIACLVWANTAEGLIHSLAFNVMFIGSISSLLFNGNPLARLDAYYILSDWLEIPNLTTRANEHWSYVIDTYVFGLKDSEAKTSSTSEGLWLLLYGLLSFGYRLILALGISMFVMDKWLLVGILFAVSSFFIWFVKPLGNIVYGSFVGEKYQRVRKRASLICLCLISLSIYGIAIYPAPAAIRAPGVLEIKDYRVLLSPAAAVIDTIHSTHGSQVVTDQILITLKSQELSHEIQSLDGQIDELKAIMQRATDGKIYDLGPLQERLAFFYEKRSNLQKRVDKLEIRALSSGLFYAPELQRYAGMTVTTGFELGAVVPEGDLELIAIVSQEQAQDLFSADSLIGEFRLFGDADQVIHIEDLAVLPQEKTELPTAALGWLGGGPLAVENRNPQTATESFYEIRGIVRRQSLGLHQRTGVLRLKLIPQPLGQQMFKALRQLLLKRYTL